MENIRTKEAREVKNFLELIKGIRWSEACLCILAFLFNRIGIQGEFYTIGISYFGSVFYTKQLRKWSFLFTVLGILSVGSLKFTTIKYLFTALFVFVMRIYFDVLKKDSDIKNQAIIAGCSIFFVSTVIAIINNISLLSIVIYLLEALVSIGLTVMFYYGNTVIRNSRYTPLVHKEMVSMTLIVSCVVAGIVDFYIKLPYFEEVFFRDIITFIILIAVAYLGGTAAGVTTSMVISTVLVLIGYIPPEFIGVYGIAVLVGGMFAILGREGVSLSLGAGLMLGFAIFNKKVIDAQIVGAYLLSICITFVIPRKYFGICNWFGYYKEMENEETHLTRVQSVITQKLQCYATAFHKLGFTFNKIMDKKVTLSKKDIQYIVEDTAEKVCKDCSMNEFCWKDYLIDSYNIAYEMLSCAEKSGTLKAGDIPEKFKDYCPNAEGFAYTLNLRLELMKQNLVWQNKFVESRELVGQQIGAVSKSISKLIYDIEKDLYFNKDEERMLREAFFSAGVKVVDILVLENNGKKEEIIVYTVCLNNAFEIYNSVIMKTIEEALGIKVKLEKYESNENDKYCCFKYKMSTTYKVASGAAFRAKNRISGDVHSFMELDDGQYLLALADGMGSGKNALEESTVAMELIEDFIDAGFEKTLAVKLINSVLVLKSNEENFSTIDVTIIDQHTGIAEFIKLGAASSFILRGGEVISIKADTLPVGILNDVDMDIHTEQLQDGDVIIMVTDGMLVSEHDFLEKEDTFKHFILEADSDNPQYMADYLMKKVTGLLGESETDDMTVVVAKIWEHI